MFYLGLTNLLFLLRYALLGRNKARVQVYYPVLIALFLFSAFRYAVGCDWYGYYNQFNAAQNFDWATLTSIREPVWWAVLALINEASLPYPVVNVVSSAVFFAGVHQLAKRQPDPLAFLVLLFPILIINMPMSGIRQGAAIGLMCVAFIQFGDRRALGFTLWTLFAATFHVSAAVFLALTPLVGGKFTQVRVLLALVLAVPGVYFLATGESLDIATSRYITSGIDAAGALFRLMMLALTSAFFLLVLRRKWSRLWPTDYRLVVFGSLAMAFTLALLPVSSVVGDRFGYYLIPIQAVMFARLPYLSLGPSSKVYVVLPYLGLLLVFAVWSQLSWHFQQCYVPYQTWLFGFPTGDPIGI